MKLKGRIALVAGATRGAGRGIALALAAEGATVYGTGRSIDVRDKDIIAVRADHTNPRQVSRVVSKIRREAGHLDILVNDIWGGDELTQWGKRMWEADLKKGLTMLERAVHSHIITSRYAIPLMLSRNGLVVEITDGDGMYYRGNFYYDLVKTSVIRMAFALSEELKRSGIAAVAVTPGFLRSEAMLKHFGVTEANWRDGAKKDPHFIASETPAYVGRAVAALAADRDIMKKSGRVFSSWDLAEEYGFTDADGSRPNFRRHIETNAPQFLFPRLDEKFWTYFEGPYDEIVRMFESKQS